MCEFVTAHGNGGAAIKIRNQKKKGYKISNKPKKMKVVSKTSQLEYCRLHTMVCQGCALTATEFICFAQ